MKGKKLPPQKTQRTRLRKKGIDVKRVTTKWTLYRLYNYYITQRHPKSDPKYLAYATGKRLEARVQKMKEPEKLRVTTGSGKRIPYKKLILKERIDIDRATQETLMPNMSVTLNRHLGWSKKMLDVLRVQIGETFTEDNYQKKLKDLAHYVHEVVMPAIEKMMEIRKKYYTQGEHLIGMKINFVTSDSMKTLDDTGMEVMVNSFHSTVVYNPLDYTDQRMQKLEQRLIEAIERGALKVFDYKNISVTLENIEIAFITRGYEEGIERLRA